MKTDSNQTKSHRATRLRLAVGRLVRSTRQHGSAGLTPSQISAMATLEELGRMRISDLAAHESMGAPVATRIVTSLEELGYVTRTYDETDKRATYIEISTLGGIVLNELWNERTMGLNTRIEKLSKSELELLDAALPVLEKLSRDIK